MVAEKEEDMNRLAEVQEKRELPERQEKEGMKEMKGMGEMRGKKRLKGMEELVWEEDGMGTVEIILIIVVLVGLVIIFKNQITTIVNNLFQKITTQTGTI